MQTVKNLARYLLIFVAVVLSSVVSGQVVWEIYQSLTQEPMGGFLDFSGLAGALLAYAFLSPLSAYLFGEKHWIWAFVVFLFPVATFEFLSGPGYMGLFVCLTIAGLAIGYGLRFLISKTLGNMPQFASWKRYF